MATQVTNQNAQTAKSSTLQRVLRGNAIFSGISSIVFIIGSAPLASFMGVPDATYLVVVGLSLLIFSAGLLTIAARPSIDRRLALAIAIADTGWVAASALVLIANLLPLSEAGRWVVALLAEVVAVFAMLQFYTLWKTRTRHNKV